MSVAGKSDGKSNNWYRLDQLLGFDRADFFIVVITLVFGALLGWAVSEVFDSDKEIELSIVICVSIVALMVCVVVVGFLDVFQKEGRSRLDTLSQQFQSVHDKVYESIDGSAVLIPRESIYPEMARCVREAQEQVVVITYFMYDWENEVRTFEPAVTGNVAGVDEFYEAIYACAVNPDVEYLRVWQVPSNKLAVAREKIAEDARLAKELELVEAISPNNPECCRVKIIPMATTASIVLIDRRTLFFNVDLFDADRNTWLSPFMLMVRDARGRAFNDLKRVVVKLTT